MPAITDAIERVDIDTAFQAELTRLLALSLSPEQEEIARRYYSQKERESMNEGSFCGPHRSFPITNQADVNNAAHLVGHADNPEAVKRCIIGKAKANGWSIPDAWKSDGDKKEDGKREDAPVIIRADGTHDNFTGHHKHAHAAYGVGGDGPHEHDHEHNDDASHQHSHAHLDGNWESKAVTDEKASVPDITRSLPSETSIYLPIERIDRARREVIVRATAERFDSYGTVIGYDGSKEAFAAWRGNIREMHDPTKAVGRAVKWEPAEEDKAIDLTLRVSRGAEDTWQKVLDGTLSGASIGARNGKWAKRTIDGKEVPFLERYDLVEVSLVDNPSCPGCEVKVVRADGVINQDILDDEEPEPTPAPAATPAQVETPEETRVGARVGAGTKASMHKTRDHMLQGLQEHLSNCGCDECQCAMNVLDPDGDGDIDIIPGLDTDNDGGGASGDGSGDGQSRALIAEIIREEIIRQMSPTLTRMSGIAARLATTDTAPQPVTPQVALPDPQLIQRLDTLEHKFADVASTTELAEVRSLLSEVKEQLVSTRSLTEQIAAQPQSGGPIVNSAALQNQPQYMQPDPLQEDAATIARLAKAGILNKNQQIDAVLYLQRQGQNGRR